MTNLKKNWYIIHISSGKEKTVEKDIKKKIKESELKNNFGKILIPSEKIIDVKQSGKKTITRRSFYPGYVLIEMIMNFNTWNLIKNIKNVTGFLGGNYNNPVSVKQEEINKILLKTNDNSNIKPKHRIQFEIGQSVRVKSGPFSNFNGIINDVNYDKLRVKVSVEIFGRSTPVELEFSQIEKN